MNSLEERVIAMVAEDRGLPVSKITPDKRLLDDLGMDGDDAVEFFEAFGERFGMNLTPLGEHWDRHFGPEGISPLAFFLVVGAIVALSLVVVSIIAGLVWLGLTSGGFLALVVGLGRWGARRRVPHLPVTVGNLIEAAQTGRWPLAYGDEPQGRQAQPSEVMLIETTSQIWSRRR